MMQPVYREAAEIAIQELQVGRDSLRKLLCVFFEFGSDQLPILGRGLLHGGKCCGVRLRHACQAYTMKKSRSCPSKTSAASRTTFSRNSTARAGITASSCPTAHASTASCRSSGDRKS